MLHRNGRLFPPNYLHGSWLGYIGMPSSIRRTECASCDVVRAAQAAFEVTTADEWDAA
jgi:hypothetical protein